MASAPQQDSAWIAEQIKSGDAESERKLVQRYSRGVMVILRNAGADPSTVDDLHQETFRIALEKLRRGDLRDASGLSGFMASLARNLATNHFRRQRRATNDDAATLESVQSSEVSALEQMVAGEQAECVRQVMGELGTERDREILRRYYLSSEDKQRICDDLGLSSLQFNRVLFRARQRYRELYERKASRRDRS